MARPNKILALMLVLILISTAMFSTAIAELLKEFGYSTGQFCKNHLGDPDEMFPI